MQLLSAVLLTRLLCSCTKAAYHNTSPFHIQVHTFKIGIYPGAILPFIIGYWADAATAVGDITATEEASGIEQRGPAHDERVQGCLLADGLPFLPFVWSRSTDVISISSSSQCVEPNQLTDCLDCH